jgi:hypothetical protein
VKEFNFPVTYYTYKKVPKCGGKCCPDSIQAGKDDCYQQTKLKELFFIWDTIELKLEIVQSSKDLTTNNIEGPLIIVSKFDPFFCLNDITYGLNYFDSPQSYYTRYD